jgi:uncharacterized membrane protein (UPF0182 family)
MVRENRTFTPNRTTLLAPRRPARTIAAIAALIFLALLVPGGMSLYVDWLWFEEIGLTGIFTREITTKLILLAGVGLLTFLILYANLRLAQRRVSTNPVRVRTAPGQEPVELTHVIQRLTLIFAIVFAAMTGAASMGNWLTVLRFLNARTFGSVDPVLGLDVGFYVFRLPVFEWIIALLTSVGMITLVALIAVYWVRGDLALLPRRVLIEPHAGVHIGAMVAVILALIAARTWWVTIPELLFSESETLHGASYTDIHARLPAFRVLAITAFLGSLFVLYGALRRRALWHLALTGIAFFLVSTIGATAIPAIVQQFVVAPTELTREEPQLASHISATRKAWDLEDVVIRDINEGTGLTLANLRNNSETVENIRLWDRDPLLQTFGQIQEIRTIYDFKSVDDDRYWIDGRYRQVLLSARELNSASLPNRNFINTHLTYTHGMGLTLGPVNQVTAEGLPVLFVKDLPPVPTVPSLRVTRPQIYFGELTEEFAIVKTKRGEFDYPVADTSATTSYSGKGGVPLSSALRRMVFATHFGVMNILLSKDILSDSRIIYRRIITDRARRAFPFLRFDADPYLVVHEDGTLKWIMDGYTSTSRYPYSRRLMDGTNYMRNSVKIVIDAYDGSIVAYVAEPDDPLVQALAAIFPGVLQPLDSVPVSLRAHLRYPEDLFRYQTELYTIYHMTDPGTFYNREDPWQIPTLDERQGPARSPFLRHIIMRLPEEDKAEFIFMTPYTPRGKDNLAAWMVARNDGEHYGELVVYRFPKQSLVFGPRQVVNRINQDTEIARQLSLWDQRGSQVIRGQLLVIPVEKSLIYVQPIYLRAEGGQIPELKRVVVAYQNRVVMEETLERGLAVIFGGAVATGMQAQTAPTPGQAAVPGAVQGMDERTMDLLRQLQQAYDRAIAAQRAGNWAEYGNEIQRLGELVRQLSARAGG